MKTAFVTGATGFVGRHLVEVLLASGAWRLIVLTRDPDNIPPSWRERLTVVEGQLERQESLECGLERGTVIFNLAGELSDASRMEAANVDGVKALLAAAEQAGAAKIVHLSTVGVIGSQRPGDITEDEPCTPQNPYEESKYRAELVISSSPRATPIIVIRPTIVFGDGERKRADSVLAMLRAIARGIFVHFGRGGIANYVYVGDVVDVCLCAAESPVARAIYNVADPCAMREIVDAAADELGVKRPWFVVPRVVGRPAAMVLERVGKMVGLNSPLTVSRVDALSSQARYVGQRIRDELGWTPPLGWRAGLAQTIAWYREKGLL